MDDIVQVRQIYQYPQTAAVAPTDRLLLQQVGIGGPYASVAPTDLVGTALANGGWQHFLSGFGLAWNGASLSSDGIGFFFSGDVGVPSLHSAGDIFVGPDAVATQINVDALFDTIIENSVFTVNGRKGNVILQTSDILQAGAAPIENAHFGGFNTSPTPWDFRANDDQIATTAFVQLVVEQLLCGGSVVTSFNGRGGAVVLTVDDVNAAYAAAVAPDWPTAPSPPLYDASNRIATTFFTDESIEDLRQWTISYIASGGGINLSAYALLASPNFSGVPTAPTATLGSSTGQLATTAFVQNAVTASTTGVASFNTRTGAVVLLLADVTGAGGAPLANPIFTGNPQAPTAAPGDNDTSIATTAFVHAAIAALPSAPVTSFNTRTGAIVLSTADVTGAGGAPLNSPGLTGAPTAPTAAPGDNTTLIATTAFVHAAVAALGSSVTSFNGRSGAVSLIGNDISAAGGALLAGPTFTGVPAAPTATVGTATTQLATTAFVQAAITAIAAGVASFNGRTGAVTLTTADVTGAGGAPTASPAFSGVPTAPTPITASNDTTVATTSFVKSAIAAGGVSSFNSRTGAVTLNSSDISAAGGALLASPGLTGVPTAPTATAGTNTGQLATTQFVTAALASAGGVSQWNGRAGSVTMTSADITGAGGALLASPTFTGTPAAPTVSPSTDSTTKLATTAFVQAAAGPQPGARVKLAEVDVSTAVATVDFFSVFTTTYDQYELVGFNISCSIDNSALYCNFTPDGSTFNTTGHFWSYAWNNNTPGISNAGGTGVNGMQLGNSGTGVARSQTWVSFIQPANTITNKYCRFDSYMNAAAAAFRFYGGGGLAQSGPWAAQTGFRLAFIASGANFTTGTFILYGIKK